MSKADTFKDICGKYCMVKDAQALGLGQSIFFHLSLPSSTQAEPTTIYAVL